MREYRQPKNSLKKQVSLLLPFEVYEGAKRDAHKYGRSMAYHIVETLRLSFDKSIQEIQSERETAEKEIILQDMRRQAAEDNESEAFCRALEAVFARFAEVKKSEEFTRDFRQDVITFARLMLDSEDAR